MKLSNPQPGMRIEIVNNPHTKLQEYFSGVIDRLTAQQVIATVTIGKRKETVRFWQRNGLEVGWRGGASSRIVSMTEAAQTEGGAK